MSFSFLFFREMPNTVSDPCRVTGDVKNLAMRRSLAKGSDTSVIDMYMNDAESSKLFAFGNDEDVLGVDNAGGTSPQRAHVRSSGSPSNLDGVANSGILRLPLDVQHQPEKSSMILNGATHAADGVEDDNARLNYRRTRTIGPIPLERIKVTTVQNFWKAVQVSHTYGQLLAAQAADDESENSSLDAASLEASSLQLDLRDTVIILPRIVTQVCHIPLQPISNFFESQWGTGVCKYNSSGGGCGD